MDTVAIATPFEAEDVTKRARRARPFALVLTFGVSIVAAATVLTTAIATVRLIGARSKLTDVELALSGVAASLAALGVLFASLRALISRWRSAPIVGRLAGGLGTALVAPLAVLGALALAWQLYGLLGPGAAPQEQAIAPLVIVGAPALVCGIALLVAIRRAAKA